MMTKQQSEACLRAEHLKDGSRFTADLWRGLHETFCVLTAIQFDAPWKKDGSKDRPF